MTKSEIEALFSKPITLGQALKTVCDQVAEAALAEIYLAR
jgi:hypothetical protein